MKKRLLSALLALALVFVLLPTTALADTTPVTDENVKINGTAVIVGNGISLGEGNGTYSYDKATHTLTLNSATINATDSNIGISFGVPVKGNIDYKIELVGNNSITSTSAQAIYVEHDTSVEAWENDTMKRSTLTINGSAGSSLILNASGYEKEAIWSKGDFTLSGGTAVTAFSSGKIAVNVGSMTINNSKLSAQSSSYGTTVVLYGFEMIGDAAEFEALNTSSGVRAVLRTSGASENIDWSKYQLITGSYSGNALTKSEPTVCDKNTLNELFSSSSTTRYIHIAKRTIPALQRTSDVLIAGKDAVVGVETSIPSANGSGTYFYDQASKTLTLKDVNIASSSIINGIQFTKDGTYTINLVGTNTMSGFSTGISANSADQYVSNINITTTGAGSLEVSTTSYAIAMNKGDLKFENTGAIKLATGKIGLNNNALSVKGNITITDMSKYSVTGTQQTGGKPLGSEVSLTEASQLKGGTTGYRIITITPAAAKPSTISYDGTTLKQGETIKDGKGGTATVATKGNTITLNNFKGTKALSFDATLADSTLVLEGTNTLSSIVTTQKGLTISGSGSLTVGSIRVPDNTRQAANLTINGGAHVTVNRPSSEDEPAVEVSGNLTVTGDGTQLSAECTAATNPAIEVGGNVTISGNPGTNAYTVKAYNKYAAQRGRDDNLRPSQMPSAFEISGNLSISGSAQVMAQTDSDGAAVWMPKEKVISVADASLIAQNRSHNFSTISFGDEDDMGNIYAKGQVNIVAENMLHSSSSLAHRAIKAFIYNHYNTGDSNPYYIKVVSEGVQSGGNVNVIPGHCTSTGGYKVTITRGGAYSAPTTISKIIITGLTPPVKGATPVDKSKVTLTDGLTVESITWGPALTSDGKFAANTAYTAHINYSVKAGYELAAKANCPQVDGANVTRWHQEGMPQDEIEVTFPKTAADTPTEKPTITLDLPAPVAGVAPVTTGVTATSSDNTPLTIDKVEWYAYTVEYNKTDGNFDRIVKGNKVSGNFEANTYYLAEITFDKSISFANGGLNITAPTWPLEGSWPESCIYRVIENSYTARILFPATDAACNHQPGDWQDGTDGEHHVKVCAICHNVVATESHAFGGYQINTNNSHTRVCSVCNAAYTNAHEFNSYAHNENSHWKVCVCGATTSYANHEFDPATGACACGATQSGGNPTPDVPAAPTGLAGVAPTSANSKDGKITGTTAAMEYATEPNGSNWIECGGDEVTGLSAGTYYVRYKRTTDKPASAVATVVVPAYSGGGEIVPPTPDNPGTIVIIRPAEEEKPAQQPNPSTGANDLVGLAVAAAVAAALGSAALLRKHD